MKKKTVLKRVLSLSAFLFYLLFLLFVVIFKARFALPVVRSERSINWIPFYYDITIESVIPPIWEIFANIAVFIPFGFFLKYFHIKPFPAFVIGFSTSLFFEVFQLVYAIGVFDVTDLLTNTAGVLSGILIYGIMKRMLKKH